MRSVFEEGDLISVRARICRPASWRAPCPAVHAANSDAQRTLDTHSSRCMSTLGQRQ